MAFNYNVQKLSFQNRETVAKSVASFKEMFELNGDTIVSISEPMNSKAVGYYVHMNVITEDGWDMNGPVVLNSFRCECGYVGLFIGDGGLASCDCGKCE